MTHTDNPSETPLPLTVRSLARWVCPSAILIALFGVYPTWLMTDTEGVLSGLVACGVVLAVMMVTGWLTVRAARKGASGASSMFMGLSLARLICCPLILWLLTRFTHLAPGTLWAWLIIMYVWCLATEVGWMVRTLAQRARVLGPAVLQPDAPKRSDRGYRVFEDDPEADQEAGGVS